MAEQEWPESDDLLGADPIAAEHVMTPHEPPDLAAAGIVLPELHDNEEADVAAAAVTMAELAEDEDAEGEPGDCPDDDDIDEPDDDGPMEEC